MPGQQIYNLKLPGARLVHALLKACFAVIVAVDAIVSLVNLYSNRGENLNANRLIATKFLDTEPVRSRCDRSNISRSIIPGESATTICVCGRIQ